MPKFNIAQRFVGEGHPVFIIAEACDNHMGDMVTALEMVRLAKLAGADAIKFQYHLPDEEMLPDTPMSSNMEIPLYEFLKRYALSLSQHKKLKKYCDEVGIQYICTPFCLKAAMELHKEGLLDVIKIGSGEMTDIPTLKHIANLRRPMIISTGMSSPEEIRETYDELIGQEVSLALMNCVSEYPPTYDDINYNFIGLMKNNFCRAVIGQSDHTPTLYTCYAAVAVGAKLIEKHVIINKLTPGPDQFVSIDFADLAELVRGIRIIEAASGSERKVHHKEREIRSWAFRSLVALRDIPAGSIVSADLVWSKRPGTGIPAKRMKDVIGRMAIRDIKANTLIAWQDLK